MSITLGTPTPSYSSNADASPDDEFAAFQAPIADIAGGADVPCIGEFDAVCTGAENVKGQWLKVVFEITDPDFAGEEFVLMFAPYSDAMSRAEYKKAKRSRARVLTACTMMGIQIDPTTQAPVGGWGVLGQEQPACRLACSTYRDKSGEDSPTIVWGRPKSRLVDGVEIGFPPEMADAQGKFRDYGCGVLPAS